MLNRNIRRLRHVAYAMMSCLAIWGIYAMATPDDEVRLTLGEPYEQVRQQSRSTLPAANDGIFWGAFVTRPASLRFTAKGYEFVTPPAKFFYVGVDKEGRVESATLSPQVATLPLHDALEIVTKLQDQLQRGGWKASREVQSRPIQDTQATRLDVRRCSDPISRWQAGSKYQVSLNIHCSGSEEHQDEDRYLITLDLGPLVFEDPAECQAFQSYVELQAEETQDIPNDTQRPPLPCR